MKLTKQNIALVLMMTLTASAPTTMYAQARPIVKGVKASSTATKITAVAVDGVIRQHKTQPTPPTPPTSPIISTPPKVYPQIPKLNEDLARPFKGNKKEKDIKNVLPSLFTNRSIAIPNPNVIKKETRAELVEKIVDRFTTYAAINSQSTDTDDPNTFPLSSGQIKMAETIEKDLRTIDQEAQMKVSRSEYGYVYATVPANTEGLPSIMFMAHLDVTPECVSGNIKPIVHRNYDGGDIQLPAGITLSPNSPQGKHLANLKGMTIITSDGSTLLGADDKTGCTVLVTLIEQILKRKNLKHGDLHFVFSQNEDIGRAADRFEEKYVGTPDIVIDVDGDDPTAFSVENFTAAMRIYRFHGKDAHPSNGFNTQYGDALTAASYFIGQLPPTAHPSASKDKQGYIHCYSVAHPTDKAGKEIHDDYIVKVRLRYFNAEEGELFRKQLDLAAQHTAEAFPFVKTETEPEVMQYENVAYTMYPGLSDIIVKAAKKMNMKLSPRYERGGTTSAMMAAKGQKGGTCLYSGQQAEHSVYEWTCAEEMLQMVGMGLSIIMTVAQ